MELESKVFVAGHRGLVGSAIVRNLVSKGHQRILTRTRSQLDLFDQNAVNRFFRDARPDYVIVAAARVGGIHANNTYPADFLYENVIIACNLLHAAAEVGTEKLLYLGSSCVYPKFAEQPIREEALLTGDLETTNEGYAIAKIAGLKLCQMYRRQHNKRFISAMPTNLYGPNDNFHLEYSHVIPGMLRRIHTAKVSESPAVALWGTGTVRREFLYVDDLAEAICVLMDKYEEAQPINVGVGEDLAISELATMVCEVVGYEGEVTWNTNMPDGTPRKLLDTTRMRSLGWRPATPLPEGLRLAYDWALRNKAFDSPESSP